MYIQDKVEEYADEIFERLQNGAVMYFCGLKGMMPGIQVRDAAWILNLTPSMRVVSIRRGRGWSLFRF